MLPETFINLPFFVYFSQIFYNFVNTGQFNCFLAPINMHKYNYAATVYNTAIITVPLLKSIK